MAKLLDATITCLIEHGYRDTSTARICRRAGVSQGGLFRHFPTRTALIAAATDEIVRRHEVGLRALIELPGPISDRMDGVVTYIREAARSPLTGAWREVLVAARTNAELREAVVPAVQHFEDVVLDVAAIIQGAPADSHAFGTLLLSVMHMFDSEATTVPILGSPAIEATRHAWAVQLLSAAVRG